MSDYSDLIERLRTSEILEHIKQPNATLITPLSPVGHKAADAIEQLYKFKILVEFIAYDYHELSHDKAQWQRDDWKKRCKKLIEEYYENTDSI